MWKACIFCSANKQRMLGEGSYSDLRIFKFLPESKKERKGTELDTCDVLSWNEAKVNKYRSETAGESVKKVCTACLRMKAALFKIDLFNWKLCDGNTIWTSFEWSQCFQARSRPKYSHTMHKAGIFKWLIRIEKAKFSARNFPLLLRTDRSSDPHFASKKHGDDRIVYFWQNQRKVLKVSQIFWALKMHFLKFSEWKSKKSDTFENTCHHSIIIRNETPKIKANVLFFLVYIKGCEGQAEFSAASEWSWIGRSP